jgi:hypothetical protein
MRRLFNAALLACAAIAAVTGLESSYQVGTLGTLLATPREPLDPLPTFVGFGCPDTNGPIYAEAITDLPITSCKEVRRTHYDG